MDTGLRIGTLLRLSAFTRERLASLKRAGIECLQLAGVVEEYLAPGDGETRSRELFRMIREQKLEVVSLFLSFPGQEWTKEGMGLTPEGFRAERMVQACRQMNWGKRYGISSIVCHVGYIPEEKTVFYERLIKDLRALISFAEENGQSFLFETGPESAAQLKEEFLELGKDNAGINFDPANLLIYDKDEPLDFLDELLPRVRSVHCKDAVRPSNGEVLGRETVLGKGSTKFPLLMEKLIQNGFRGPLIIERELPPGPEQERDIGEAVILINNIKQNILEQKK